MSVVQSGDFQQVTAVAVAAATETVVAVSTPTAVLTGTCKVAVKAFIVLTVGASTTAITLRIYRGASSAGLLIGVPVALAGMFNTGSPTVLTAFASDQLNNAGQAQYCVTLQQTGGTAGATVNIGCIETTVLSG
jgi:hypothetical protein